MEDISALGLPKNSL